MSEREKTEWAPDELYERTGFRSLQEMNDYASVIGKPQRTDYDYEAAYQSLFGHSTETRMLRMAKFKPPVVPIEPSKVWIFNYKIHLGAHPNGHIHGKSCNIKIDGLQVLLKDVPPTLRAQYIALQLTPILGSEQWHDQLFVNIRYYKLVRDVITIYVGAYRSNGEGWGLELYAFLTITIHDKPINVIE